jgi:hypothetical protein
VSKAGNPRLRTTLIQLAWLWLRNQPHSALTLWSARGGELAFPICVAGDASRPEQSFVPGADDRRTPLWIF